jgi:Phasin protein
MSAPALFGLGNEQADTMVNMQREVLAAYEHASRSWLARVKSEVDLWSELAEKLGKTRSLAEAVGAYQQCVAQRVHMTADDGRRLLEEYQTLLQKITRPFSGNGPQGTT